MRSDQGGSREPLTFADLVAKVRPAVVSINVKSDAKVAENGSGPKPRKRSGTWDARPS